MGKLRHDFKFLMVFIFVLIASSCVTMTGEKMKTWTEMTPKEKVTMAYGTYNSQFVSYMTDTGWSLNPKGVWEKVESPVLSSSKKDVLQKKRVILTELYPLIKIYDEMVLGTVPYSADLEKELFDLIDDLVRLI